MPLEDVKIAVAIAWAIVCGVIAVSLSTSVSSWILIVGSAVLPAFAMLRLWHPMRTVPIIREPRK
jgi:uncharacterized sodium:solute symporter family permease YidK